MHFRNPETCQSLICGVKMLIKLPSPLVSAFTLLFLVASGTSREDHDEDQGQGVPTLLSPDESDDQLSWQSAFWALVAITLSTATQPSGRIVGLPSSWVPALTCSPVFCIINAVEALNCIRIRRDPEWTLVVAPHKYDTDEDLWNLHEVT